MVKKINETLMHDSGKLFNLEFVVIHNDAGSMTPEQYVDWLRYRDKALGIAHYYCNRNTIARVIDTFNIGYHTGDWWSNCRSIGYEVCESMKVSDEEFLQNEDMTLMQATEDLIYYGLPINTSTVRLHHEFVPTTCPHRSMELHGGTTESVKNYFVSRMQYFASLGSTVDEMLGQVSSEPTVQESVQSEKPTQKRGGGKSVDEVAQEVLQGLWGNGEERFNNLTNAGYDAQAVQDRVNTILNGETPSNSNSANSDLDSVAQEVLQGLWGNGQERYDRLTNAGYNAQEVQDRVNSLLSGEYNQNNYTNLESVAQEVIQGLWGNGQERFDNLTNAGYDAQAVQNRVNELLS
ncbi:N-acetylmuramoyl-L-alanine amidase [uncultured Granulicatella sp.]|uniref:N-acetylmuramoyl-L-alanine amidase n=1 Tax=uncultured Granulicatella sp. TaxID=316089 RepID=UPI0026195444|nr:N-acetylmuramoyl-L-alanine amidase [uncultured Granulicatella sp.]